MAETSMTETENNAGNGRRISSDFLDGLESLGLLRQLGLMIGLAASVAIGFAAILWLQEGDYRPLYGSMENLDAPEVVRVLDGAMIDYRIDTNSGALLVAADQVHNARMKLAEAGLQGDGSVGFELLDKEQPLGTSQFMEQTRFRRGLEGELARTISSIQSVRSARVHLAIPKTSVFIRDPRRPSASVFLEVYAGRTMQPSQIQAIGNLVASSVPELSLGDVTVVDQRGNLLSRFNDSDEFDLANKQLDYQRKLEDKLSNRVYGILEPLLGPGRFKAEVSADVDFTRVEQAAETFNPEAAVRSEQVLDERRSGSAATGGIPGALSNQPPANAFAPEDLQNINGANGDSQMVSGNRTQQSTRNYELDRTVSYTRHQVGRVTRLTVAVVVDDLMSRDGNSGDSKRQPWKAEDLERLTTLVRNAVGYDAARGDSVEVINNSFMDRPEEFVEDLPFYQQDWFAQYAKLGVMVLVLLAIVFGVLRPMFKNLSDSARNVKELDAQRELEKLEGMDGEYGDPTVTLSGANAILLPGPDESYEQQVSAIKQLISEDSGRVAQVVKKWVQADD